LSWKFSGPIKFGDTIHAIIQISSMRPTRAPDRGIIVQATQLLNQRGEIVQSGELTLMVKRRPASDE
jgi:acyl dehydratase